MILYGIDEIHAPPKKKVVEKWIYTRLDYKHYKPNRKPVRKVTEINDKIHFGNVTERKYLKFKTKDEGTQRCLVVIAFGLRNIHMTFKSIEKHLLDRYKCDLALSVPETNNYKDPWFNRARYIWNVGEPRHWQLAYDQLFFKMRRLWKAKYNLRVRIWKSILRVKSCP